MNLLKVIRDIFDAIRECRKKMAARREFRRRIEKLQRIAEYYYNASIE